MDKLLSDDEFLGGFDTSSTSSLLSDDEFLGGEEPSPEPERAAAATDLPKNEDSWAANIERGVGERGLDLLGGMARSVGTGIEAAGDFMESIVPLGKITRDESGFHWESIDKPFEEKSEVGRTFSETAKGLEDQSFGYEPGTSWEDFKASPVRNFVPFAIEQGLVSIPDMVAAIKNIPGYIVSRTGEIGQTRAVNDERGEATLGDLLAAMPAATASALLERLGTSKILGLEDAALQGLKELPKAAGKAAAVEAGTEAAQETIESAGETLGTAKGFDLAETAERAAAGAVGGAGFGGMVRTGTGAAEIAAGREQGVPEGASPAEELFDADPETDRPGSPRLTPEDRASPLPNDLIDDGKKIFEEALGGKGGMAPRADDIDQQVATDIELDAAVETSLLSPQPAPPASIEAPAGPVTAAEPEIAPAGLPDSEFLTAGETNPEPTPAQAEAGNYSKRHTKVHGLDVSIETEKDGIRRSKPGAAEPWEVKMPAAYGDIKRTTGADGDNVDVYLGPQPSDTVYIVDQIDADSRAFDEHKILIDFPSREAALAAYEQAFSDERGAERVGAVTEMPVFGFKQWLKSGDTTQPLSYVGPQTTGQKVTSPSEAAPANWFQSLVDDEKDAVKGQMRDLADKAQKIYDNPLNRAPSGSVAAGSEGARQALKAEAIESVLRAVRAGKTPDEAIEIAKSEIRATIKKHNARSRDMHWGVDDGAYDSEIKHTASMLRDALKIRERATKTVKQRTAPVQKGPRDIIQFLAQGGGVQDFKGELRSIDAHKAFVPGAGKLVREKGMPLDTAREAAAEMGYFDHLYGDRETASAKSTVADLLDLIAETRRGNRQYSSSDEAEVSQTVESPEEEARRDDYDQTLKEFNLSEAERAALDQAVADGQWASEAVFDILERSAIAFEADTHDSRGQGETDDGFPPFDIGAEDRAGEEPEDQGRGRQAADEGAEDRSEAPFGEPRRSEPVGKPEEDGEGQGALKTETVDTEDGKREQVVLPGAERISQKQQAEREADKPMRPKVPQKDAGELFDTQARSERQDDMFAATPAPRVPPVASRSATTSKIDDFGEKIAGARKDMVRDLTDSLAADIDIATEPLSKIFPQPDYAKLAEQGVDRRALALIALVREEIPAKPRKGYKVARWVESVKTMRGFARSLLEGDYKPDVVRDRMRLDRSLSGLWDTAAVISDLDPDMLPQAAKWRVRSGSYSFFNGERFDRPQTKYTLIDDKGRMAMGADRKPVSADTLEGITDIARGLIRIALGDKPTVAKRTPLSIYSDRITKDVFIGFKGQTGVIRLKTGFATAKDARSYMAEHADELQTQIDEMRAGFNMRRAVNRPREGVARREGGVTPEQFQEAFGFRGVQFGNYVEGDRRQFELNEAFDGLMDLADVLKVPPRAISLNGTLGLAFGARGRGGAHAAKAHYEPDQVVINLTKSSGAGSLAHEWFHGVDNYFGRQDTGGKMTAFASDMRASSGKVRPSVWEAWRMVEKSLTGGSYSARMRKADEARSKPYWNTMIEKAARGFEKYVVDRLATEKATNDYLANIDENAGAYPNNAEMRDQGITAAFDDLFNAIETQETPQGVEMFSLRAKVADDRIQPTDAFKDQAQTIGKRLRAELDRLGLKDIGLRISEQLGLMVDGKFHAADGSYFRKMIEIALDADNPDAVLDHEAIHALRDVGAFGKDEWSILERKSRKEWVDRYEIPARYSDFADDVHVEEGIAHAYADWRNGARMDGIIAKAFKKIRSVLQAIGRAFGKDFRTAEDVFAQVASGEIGSRPRPGEEFFANPPNAEGDERFKLRSAPSNAQASQQVMQGFIARGQPIDRAIRLPFDLLGGLDEHGRWNPGKRITEKVTDVLVRKSFDPNGRFRFLHGMVENARRGLVDRYGLDKEYVEADRRRAMHERGVLQQASDVLKVLSNAGVGTQEAKVLQAILTGEAVNDTDMTRLAVPIRQAIDDLGAEAVSLGLISAESFERNRGSYLHRVYQKNEIDQGTLAGWVSKQMTSRRRRIIGDEMKGRGMFWDVPVERLLRNSEAAQAMRQADSGIGEAERRIETLTGRRKVLDAEMEALGREMAAHMGRRMDVADRATIKKLVGDSRVTKPTGFQKGQVREQAVALNRLRDRIEQREAALDKIDGEIAAAEKRLDELSDHLIAQSEDLSVTKDRKFIVLDKKREIDGKEKVTQRVYIPADEPVPDRFTGPEWVNRGTWEARSISKKQITLWRDYTKAEREKMGEIVDARYTIGKTFMLLANDLATGRFFKDVAENEAWAQTAPPPAEMTRTAEEYSRFWNDPEVQWVHVPDTAISNTGGKKRWGALAGKYVRAEIWRDLAELQSQMTPGPWRKLLRQWKMNKTSRSPVVHMNNIMSNMMFMDLADVRMQDLVAGIRAYVKGEDSKDFREARDNGAFGADMMSQEIRDNVLKPLLEEIVREQQGGTASTFLANAGSLGRLADRLWTWAKAADDGMIRAYQAEDELFRMATYLRRRAQGESPEVAAANARDQFLNYDIRAPWINTARNTVFPFIGYTYRAIPKLAENLAHRPWKMAKYMAIAYAANALAYLWDDGDDGEEREREALRDEEQGNTWLQTPRMLRMPWRDSAGLPVFMDVRRWVPAGDIFDTNQGSSALPIPAPLQFGGPFMLAAEFLLNRQAFTGKDLTDELTDDLSDKTEKVGDWLWKSWMPGAFWVPNSWYWTKISNALNGATDTAGRTYSVPQAFLSSVGIKVRPVDVEDGLKWHAYDFKKANEALRAAARSLGRQRERNLISQSAFDGGMAKIMEKFARLDADYKAFAERSQPKKQ